MLLINQRHDAGSKGARKQYLENRIFAVNSGILIRILVYDTPQKRLVLSADQMTDMDFISCNGFPEFIWVILTR